MQQNTFPTPLFAYFGSQLTVSPNSPQMVGAVVEPPVPAEPPHIAIMFGAWQRRAVLSMAGLPRVAPRLLRYGFYADASVEEPKLLCKNIDQYELRPEKELYVCLFSSKFLVTVFFLSSNYF